MEHLELIISFAALLLSVFTLLRTSIHERELRIDTARSANLAAILQVEQQIAQNPGLLQLHGIDPAELEEAGVTPEEFAYLLASFTAGGIYHKLNKEQEHVPFDEHSNGAYRFHMCKSEKTRKAWRILKRIMSNSSYTSRIDATIRFIENGADEHSDTVPPNEEPT